MKKKILICLIMAIVAIGCAQQPSEDDFEDSLIPAEEKTPEKISFDFNIINGGFDESDSLAVIRSEGEYTGKGLLRLGIMDEDDFEVVESSTFNISIEKAGITIVSIPRSRVKVLTHIELCMNNICRKLEIASPNRGNLVCLRKSGDEKLCEANSNCRYSMGSCTVIDCSSFITKEQCEIYPKCRFMEDSTRGYCRPAFCWDNDIKEDCEAKEECGWKAYDSKYFEDHGNCYQKSCYDLNLGECEGSILGCEVIGEKCQTFQCDNMKNETMCVESRKCRYTGSVCVHLV